MSYDMNRIKWILTRRYHQLLERSAKLRIEAPEHSIIEQLVQKFLVQGAICHYCGRDLNLYSNLSDHKFALSLDHKVPISNRPDNSAENLIICCYRCNMVKGRMPYETFKQKVDSLKFTDRNGMEKFLDEEFKKRVLKKKAEEKNEYYPEVIGPFL
jgi:5-methylcytosine-specific restriction endonuclease McrA